MKKFYGRKKELKTLNSFKSGTNFVVVYGRRRIGKTRLLLEHLEKREYVYMFVPSTTGVNDFLSELSKRHNIPLFLKVRDALNYIFNNHSNVFIDEFQNLGFIEKNIYSYMQEIIDNLERQKRNVNIFVAGSSHSMMKYIFMNSSKPLYGRTKAIIHLGPLSFKEIYNILEDNEIKNISDKIKYYSVFGGIPKYYDYINSELTPEENITELFFNEFAPLKEEGNVVLISEFGGEHQRYLSVLNKISAGPIPLKTIASGIGTDASTANKYLDILRTNYMLIKRTVPVTDNILKSKNGLYHLKDNFLLFWMKFVKRYEAYYQQDMMDLVIENFYRDFSSFISFRFETIIRDIIRTNHGYDAVGRWWNRKGDEIDIVAYNEKNNEILFGEVKWSNKPVNPKIIEELKEKSKLVEWNKEKRKEFFIIISKAGFTKECVNIMKKENIIYWDIKDIEKMIDGR